MYVFLEWERCVIDFFLVQDKVASFTVYRNYWDWESGSAQGGLVSAKWGSSC